MSFKLIKSARICRRERICIV